MSAYDMNDEIMGGVMAGMKAAADRFGDRMQRIHDDNIEQKHSVYWKNYAENLAKRVDDLTRLLNKQNATSAERELALRQSNARVEKYRSLSKSHADYLDLVIKRLMKVEDMLQRQSARAFALDEFRRLALAELETIHDPAQSKLIDPVKRTEMLDNAYDEFMKTTNVKRGVPRFGVDEP